MIVDREELLNCLQAVQPGLSKREIVEQSCCFVFSEGRVMTFNDEIACTHESPLNIVGAVQADPLLNILSKLQEETLEFEEDGGELTFKGKKRRGGIRMESEVLLPIDSIKHPKKWKPLPSEFAEGLSLVEKCAGKDEDKFITTCVGIYPGWVEAYDNLQVGRFNMKINVDEPILVRRNSIRHIYMLDVTEFGETKSWIHFRNPSGLILSCRKHLLSELDEAGVLDTSSILKVKGSKIVLPKGLSEAAQKAEIFSQDNSDDTTVMVELKPDKLRITGRGVSGWYQELKSVQYDGASLSFRIDPKLLASITERHNECELTESRLKIDSKKFIYVTVLG